jgi:Xaa-Pro dipeptidase
MLSKKGLGGVLLNAQHNFSWLSCGGSNGIDLSRENGAGFLFVTSQGKRYLIANNIEMPRLLAEQVSVDDFEPIELTWQAEKDPKSIIHAAGSLTIGDLGCDIGFPETRSIETSIAECRAELTPEEVTRYKELGRDCGHALGRLIPTLSPGMRETAVVQIVRDALQGFDIFPVVTLIGADDRIAKYRHPVATENVWTNTLMIVVCGKRDGLVASLTRMVCAGAIPAELQRRTESCAAVNAALYHATRAGATAAELYKVADEAYAAQGFEGEINKHHQGGAAGYRTRDWVAHPGSADVVRPNQAFAWNPSISGTKTEETAILIDDQLQIVTATEGYPEITTVIEGREYSSPGILSLSKGASA